MISPTADGIDYDWEYFGLDKEYADALMELVPRDKIEPKYNPVEIAYNLLVELLDDMDTKNADEMYIGDVIKSAVDYLREALE